MAVFDLDLQRVCVRVVYDGPGHAGKTTNVRQLSAMFPSRHATEVLSPSELHDRTLSFDWLQIRAGVVAGFPLICQIITVPGQSALTARRRYLLQSADVVVYVCDSLPSELPRAKESLAVLDAVDAEREFQVPIVLQANKQDQIGALRGDALARTLGLVDVPIVEAIALDGGGVMDTFVQAVRAIGRTMQKRIDAGHFRIPVRRTDTPGALLVRVAGQELDRDAAAEMLLSELSVALERETPIASIPVEMEQTREAPISPRQHGPILPRHDVPQGHVWPAHTGREILSALVECAIPAIEDDKPIIVHAGDFMLTTSAAERYPDIESARPAIVRAARDRTQLGALLDPDTVVVLQPADDGSCWLWTLQRDRETCDVAIARGAAASLVEKLAVAVAELLSVAAKNRFAVDLRAACFTASDSVRYVGRLDSLSDARALADAFAGLVVELGSLHVLEVFLPAFEIAVARLSAEERSAVRDHVALPG